jgi:hypothetical protein
MFAYISLYSALFWTNGVGAAFTRTECSIRIGSTIIVLDMRTESESQQIRKLEESTRFDHLSLLSPPVGLAKKNRSRHPWSILLSKLSSALFYTLFGVMG